MPSNKNISGGLHDNRPDLTSSTEYDTSNPGVYEGSGIGMMHSQGAPAQGGLNDEYATTKADAYAGTRGSDGNLMGGAHSNDTIGPNSGRTGLGGGRGPGMGDKVKGTYEEMKGKGWLRIHSM